MTMTRRSLLSMAAMPFVVSKYMPDDLFPTVTDGLNSKWDGVVRFPHLQAAYETVMNATMTPQMILCSPRSFAYMQYVHGNPGHGWFDFVKSDIRKRLARRPIDPRRLPT